MNAYNFAIAAWLLPLTALILTGIAILAFRLEYIGFGYIFMGAGSLFLASVLSSISLCFSSVRAAMSSAQLISALGISIPFYLFVVFFIREGQKYPPINDIVTSHSAVPSLAFAEKLRKASDNVIVQTPSTQTYEAQRSHWPQLEPLTINAPLSDVYSRALMQAQAQWRVVDSGVDEDANRAWIHAVDKTLLLNYKDDIAVEFVYDAQLNSTIVHMRSSSRSGRSDFGVNANRILEYFALLSL